MKKRRFCGAKIDISRRVFTPRIETEFWIKKVIEELSARGGSAFGGKIDVLDIFAGIGCIGIALLKARRNVRVNFLDIDEEAIKQIKINLEINKISKKRYKVYKSDLFEKLKNKKYDLIFANPPYVALDRIYEVQKEVLEKESHLALFAGKDGMFFIKKFLNRVGKYLKPGGKIFMEFDPFQKNEIEKILTKNGFKFIIKKDQFKKFRWLKAEAIN